MKVLFICRSNAARSQMAEAFYNKLTNSTDATSAGVDLANSVMGDSYNLPPAVIEVMQARGYDVSEKRRKQLAPALVDTVDKVIAITDHQLPSYVTDSPKFTRWLDIPDPKGLTVDEYANTRDMVYEHVKKLVAETTGPANPL